MCFNHREISLIFVVSKLAASVVLRRLSRLRKLQCREEQVDVHPDRGFMDRFLAFCPLLEYRHVHQGPTIVMVLDTRAALTLSTRQHCGPVC